MSKSDILGELPNLAREDRREILERIWEMEEAELLKSAQPDAAERALLDNELRESLANSNAGSEWKEVESRLSWSTPQVSWRVIIRPKAEADLSEA